MSRIFNFNAGPAALPLEVLEEVQAELLDFNNTGMSILKSAIAALPLKKCWKRPNRILRTC